MLILAKPTRRHWVIVDRKKLLVSFSLLKDPSGEAPSCGWNCQKYAQKLPKIRIYNVFWLNLFFGSRIGPPIAISGCTPS